MAVILRFSLPVWRVLTTVRPRTVLGRQGREARPDRCSREVEAAPDLTALTWDGFHLAGGAGLRFTLLPETGMNLGIDAAAGDAGPTLCIPLGGAF